MRSQGPVVYAQIDRTIGPGLEIAGITAKRKGEGSFIFVVATNSWQASQDDQVSLHPGREGLIT